MKKVIIGNLTEFFKTGFERPFKVLAELEEHICKSKNEEHYENGVLIPYSKSSDVVFILYKIEYKDGIKVYYFNYNTTIS